jgi:diketogulonate reductase-like aldo/keto reductase
MNKFNLSDGGAIPVIGFGTWRLSPKEALKSVTVALHTGYRLIDTAKIYGNETEVGEAIRKSEIKRREVFVTTKLWPGDLGYDTALDAFEASRQRLGLDYIDLYLIHWPGDDRQRRADGWKALCELKQRKLVKHIGVSNYTVHHLEEMKRYSDVPPAVNQIEFHPFIYSQQAETLDYCRRHNIVVEAYSPLAQGRMSDKRLANLAKSYGKSPSQVMLRWAMQKGTIPLPRSADAKHIQQNHDIFDFELSDEDIARLDGLG